MRLSKKIIARSILVVLYILLVVVMFLTGRTHTILIDNKGDPDGAYKAVKGMEVRVDSGEPVEFMKGDRDKFPVKAQKHTIDIEFFDGSDPVSFTVTIPVSYDYVLLSIPKYLAGIEPYMEEFDIYASNKAEAMQEESN
ncbi:MAG: hypothetical protein KBT02_10140 [Treponema sp.]|nr:hypothetical protein [Candidatus Treponema caballi]